MPMMLIVTAAAIVSPIPAMLVCIPPAEVDRPGHEPKEADEAGERVAGDDHDCGAPGQG
jgi:hypothetical protein